MDIRKWLTSPKGGSKAVNSKIENDLGTSRNSKRSPKKTSTSRKRRIVESDSDEEPLPKEKKEPDKGTKNSRKSTPEKKQVVSVAAFFGSAPVLRGKGKEIKKKTKESVHEDADFEATLSQLNSKPSKEAVKTEEERKSSPVKEKHEGKSVPVKKKSKSDTSVKIEVTANTKKSAPKDEPEEKPPPKKHKGSGANYASYLSREGPKALGSKEIPEGEEDCLAGLTFIITGILESMERDEAKSLVEKYGGKVMSTLSKNTKYIVIGRDAGASKLEKAEKFGTKQLDEDGLLDLIRTLPGKSGTRKNKTVPKNDTEIKKLPSKNNQKSSEDMEIDFMLENDDLLTLDASEEVKSAEISLEENKVLSNSSVGTTSKTAVQEIAEDSDVLEKSESEIVQQKKPDGLMFSLWVDKYKPNSLKQIIGQQGDKSNAKKLLYWLTSWRRNRQLNKRPMPHGRWNAQDDGSSYKAALLSGPPGVGKTTTAQIVCKEAGYEYFEMNASDTRSKKYLQQSVSQLLGNQTLTDCFKENCEGKVTKNHVIIMDEVDGMAGNEDRGGMRELIDFIKASKVPIICICNDRNHPKIRSLSNYCFDLRFQKPRVEQIKAAMMSIAFKEGIKVTPNVLQDVIVASNQDIRQVLHNMSVWSAKSKGLSPEQTKYDVGKGTKHIKMGPFDVLREVFAIGNNPKATLNDKSDLFFHDYSIAPLFVQENYIHVIPSAAEGNKIKHLTLLSEAADSICIGDIVDRQIRNQNSWSLLPTQAIFASVVPGELLRGHLKQMINFPGWLGKNSNRKYMDRILQELHVHMRMRITGNKTDVALEYLPLLKRALTKPLIENEQSGVHEVLKTMEEYFLLREDFDSIIDLSLWPEQIDPRTKIISKVKSAFTRAYNKESGKNPYTIKNVKKKKGTSKEMENDLLDDENEGAYISEEEDDKLENDAMIKIKKPSKRAAALENESSTSKEKKNPKKGKTK